MGTTPTEIHLKVLFNLNFSRIISNESFNTIETSLNRICISSSFLVSSYIVHIWTLIKKHISPLTEPSLSSLQTMAVPDGLVLIVAPSWCLLCGQSSAFTGISADDVKVFERMYLLMCMMQYSYRTIQYSINDWQVCPVLRSPSPFHQSNISICPNKTVSILFFSCID